MKSLFVISRSGISGDMVISSLLSLLNDDSYFLKEIKKLKLKGVKIKIGKKKFGKTLAKTFTVIDHKEVNYRTIDPIFKILDASSLSQSIVTKSKAIFLELGRAESTVHEIPLEKVHFHEVGAVDTILDIVGTCILLERLQIETIYSTPIVVGKGKKRIAHGIVDLPVPAVRVILDKVPRVVKNIPKELTTPTGASIIKTLASEFVSSVDIRIEKKGFGAASQKLPIPNMLEVQIGVIEPKEKKILLETNIDDMNPEIYPYVIDKLMAKGAIDAYIHPCIMKKNRQGSTLSVICTPETKGQLADILFFETSTFGIRELDLARFELDREKSVVKTKYGNIGVKVGIHNERKITAQPEFEDCRKIALKNNLPLKKVYEIAQEKFFKLNPNSKKK